MDEGKARKDIDRAHRAQRIFEDELFQDAVEAVKEKLWKEFATSEISDDDTRRNARIGLDLLNRILKQFRKHMEDGKVAKADLARFEKQQKRRSA